MKFTRVFVPFVFCATTFHSVIAAPVPQPIHQRRSLDIEDITARAISENFGPGLATAGAVIGALGTMAVGLIQHFKGDKRSLSLIEGPASDPSTRLGRRNFAELDARDPLVALVDAILAKRSDEELLDLLSSLSRRDDDGFFSGLVNKVKSGFNKVKDGVKDVVEDVKGDVKGAVEDVKGVVSDVKESFKVDGDDIKDKFKDAVDGVKDKVKDKVGGFTDVMKDLFSDDDDDDKKPAPKKLEDGTAVVIGTTQVPKKS